MVFPGVRPLPDTSPLGRVRIALRPATGGDEAFLRDLYGATRTDELDRMPWPSEAKAAFLRSQFDLQHRHFASSHPDGDYLIIQRRSRPCGRLYLDRSRDLWRVLELAVAPASQGLGTGTLVLRWVQRSVVGAAAAGVDLHVAGDNLSAAALYGRLGFAPAIDASTTHRRFVWHPPATV